MYIYRYMDIYIHIYISLSIYFGSFCTSKALPKTKEASPFDNESLKRSNSQPVFFDFIQSHDLCVKLLREYTERYMNERKEYKDAIILYKYRLI